MKTYIFKTTATMKEYNRQKWWIDGNVVTEKRITAESLKAALDQFVKLVEEKHYITGKTDFQDDFGRWSGQYIDLWVEILSVSPVDFEGEAA